MKKIFQYIAVLLLIVITGSCTNKFNEINTDPDAYSTAPYTNILCYCLQNTAMNWGDDLSDLSSWAGFISKIQYPDNYHYISTDNFFGNKWLCTYTTVSDLNDIMTRSQSDTIGNKNMRNVCKVWKCFLVMMTTDCYGDIPYSEAWKATEGILKTPYDSQKSVYASIDSTLSVVADSWAVGEGTDDLGSGDVLFNGSIEKWQRFCNSLRLRLAMRLVNVEPDKSKATVEEILNNSTKYPVIDNCDDNAYQWWDGTSTYYDRYYNDYLTRDDYGISEIFMDYLVNQNDPRRAVIAKVAASDGKYRGEYNGVNSISGSINQYSRMGAFYRENPKGFSPYYKACETYFAEAEASMRGWNVPLTAEEAYDKGVTCSMTDNGLSVADANTYLENRGKFDGTYSRLYHEWWTSLFKENIEAWSLYRRTGYPDEIHNSIVTYSDKKTVKQYPGEYCYYGTTHNDVPFRFPYPNNQELYNVDNLNKVQNGIKDYCWGKKMYWDTRSDTEYY